jgi:hypothetical protein
MQLQAAKRLLASVKELEAQFDTEREEHLRTLQNSLYKAKLVFTFDQHHLFHKTNEKDVHDEIERIIQHLEILGYKLQKLPGVIARKRFALKGTDGIVFQRFDNHLRIFFQK